MLLLLAMLFTLIDAQNQVCTFGRDSGDSSCSQPGGERFYFHPHTKLCQPFYYKGCTGNANRFATRAECVATCANATASFSSSDVHDHFPYSVFCPAGNVAANDMQGPLPCDKCPRGYECQNGMCCGTRESTCSLAYDAGRYPAVGWHVPMFFYSKAFKNCLVFTYFGSEGNPNTFRHYNDCIKFCT
ncbi:hypothetical protein PENTCL1PPCAC_19505 [Pristionchus entomophagus]|uniref:BPTI/Kunitz inhibitor domain-containing protein n=1 Tax=Pristionchus entomophagus TaxID=358040 RepID=A0AAV5TS73_9BILA|nr:hypothetical protein PENTCL1PPCAC_19505 [Pristionchus entomophagus]